MELIKSMKLVKVDGVDEVDGMIDGKVDGGG